MTNTAGVGHPWSLTSVLCFIALTPILINSTPINRQVGISENVFITVQNDTYGIEQRVCSIDSMTYGDGETIPTSSPCEHCICRPPGFACTIISCEYRPGCKSFKRSNQCCPEYQCECEKDGKIYQNGEKIMDSNNPCEICYCQGGEIICAVIDCYWRSDCQPRYIENRCCPLYDHCPPPSNQGPFPRPTIPTTTTSSGFPWFNLSSAVYEIPEASSVTPVPFLESSTSPTTTPLNPQSELVVVATENTPVQINIMSTSQEGDLLNVTAITSEDSQSAPQQVVEVETEGLRVPAQEQLGQLQNTSPLEDAVVQALPAHSEINESVPVLQEAQPSPGPVETAVNDTFPVNEPTPINSVVNDIVPSTPEVNEIVVSDILTSDINETMPALSVPEVNETVIPASPNTEVNENVPDALDSEVNQGVLTDVGVKDRVPVHEVINESALVNTIVNENTIANNEVINSVAPANENVNEVVAVDAPETEKVNEMIQNQISILADETNTAPSHEETIPANSDPEQSVPVSPEIKDSISETPSATEASAHLSPNVQETIPIVPEVIDSFSIIKEAPEAPKTPEIMPTNTAEVSEAAPVDDEVNSSVSVNLEGGGVAQINEVAPNTDSQYETTPINELLNETVPVAPETSSDLLVNQHPDVNEIVPLRPEIQTEAEPPTSQMNDNPSEIREEVPSTHLQPSSPLGVVTPASTTLVIPPAVAISIIPSPVEEELLVTQEGPAVPPEVFSQVIEDEVKVALAAQEPIKQSENGIKTEDDQLVIPTRPLPDVAGSSAYPSKPQDPVMESDTYFDRLSTWHTLGPSEVVEATESISPSAVLQHELLTFTSVVSELSEVPTTGAPLQDEPFLPSVSFDRVPQLEIEETTVNKETLEASQTEPTVVKPVPSIATILIPPNRDETAPSSIDVPTLVDEIPGPSLELEPPTQEFVTGGFQDEPESPTTISSNLQDMEDSHKTQDEPSISSAYLPIAAVDDKVVEEEVTTQPPHPSAAVVFDSISEIETPVNTPGTPDQSPIDTEFLEDSPVHIQGSESSENFQTPILNDQSTDRISTDIKESIDDSTAESIVPNTEHELHETVTNESIVSEMDSTTLPAIPQSSEQISNSPIEAQKEEIEQINDDPELVEATTSSPKVPEISTSITQSPVVLVPLILESDDVKDNTFEIIPPNSENVPSEPEIQNQIRDKEEGAQTMEIQTPETVGIQQDDNVQEVDAALAHKKVDSHLVQNDAPYISSDDDTVEIFAETLPEVTTQASEVIKKIVNDVQLAPEFNFQDDTVEVLAGDSPADFDAVTTSAPIIPQKEDELVEEDEEEEIHPDDHHEDDQDKVILTTAEPLQKDEVAITAPSTAVNPSDSDAEDESINRDENENKEEETFTTIPPPIERESEDNVLHRDQSGHVEKEDENFDASVTTEGFGVMQVDDDSQTPMITTTTDHSGLMNKVQKVAEKLKSVDEDDALVDESSSASKFRLDLSAFEESAESAEKPVLTLPTEDSREEVQSTPAPFLIKLENDDVVFDEAQQTPTHRPLVLSQGTQEQTTERVVKLSRDDIESSDLTTTGSPLHKDFQELRDDSASFTTTNPGRSDSVTNVPDELGVTEAHPGSEENFINDEESVGESTSIHSLRLDDSQESTSTARASETENGTNPPDFLIRSDNVNLNDFVELSTGSPLGYAAEYHDDGLTTETPALRSESYTEAHENDPAGEATLVTTVDSIIFDDEQKSTTLESMVGKAKSESLVDDGTTPQDLLSDESVDVTATTELTNSSELIAEISTTSKTAGRIDQMIIPEKGFPQIDPVAHEMIPRKEDKLARIDLNDDDSWFYQTFNKIRQLSGLFPTQPNRQRKLTRQPRALPEGSEAPQNEKSIKSKAYFKKTKKATGDEEAQKYARRKAFLPSRSFLFF